MEGGGGRGCASLQRVVVNRLLLPVIYQAALTALFPLPGPVRHDWNPELLTVISGGERAAAAAAASPRLLLFMLRLFTRSGLFTGRARFRSRKKVAAETHPPPPSTTTTIPSTTTTTTPLSPYPACVLHNGRNSGLFRKPFSPPSNPPFTQSTHCVFF